MLPGERDKPNSNRIPDGTVRDVHIGQILAGLFALGGLSVSALAVWLNAPWVATIIGGGTIGPIVYAFLRKTQSEEK